MNAHYYLSTIKMEYFYFNDIMVLIQEGVTSFLPDYALIATTISFDRKSEYDFLKEKGLLEEISVEEFNFALNRAINIIKRINDNYMIKEEHE